MSDDTKMGGEAVTSELILQELQGIRKVLEAGERRTVFHQCINHPVAHHPGERDE